MQSLTLCTRNAANYVCAHGCMLNITIYNPASFHDKSNMTNAIGARKVTQKSGSGLKKRLSYWCITWLVAAGHLPCKLILERVLCITENIKKQHCAKAPRQGRVVITR
eukprot:1408805-Amphidinium_carterae.1